MYVVLETGGKQYRVSEGDVLKIERLEAEEGSKVELDKVLLYSNDGSVEVGAPYLSSVKVECAVVENGKSPKVVVYKYKPKKGYHLKKGHRQPFTMVKIEKITKK